MYKLSVKNTVSCSRQKSVFLQNINRTKMSQIQRVVINSAEISTKIYCRLFIKFISIISIHLYLVHWPSNVTFFCRSFLSKQRNTLPKAPLPINSPRSKLHFVVSIFSFFLKFLRCKHADLLLTSH